MLRQREETAHPGAQLLKKINNRLVTQRQIGDSQPFSPCELITMYPGQWSVTTKCQQTGDKAKEEKIQLSVGRATETIIPSV